jgi:hypothetical protein
MSEVQDTGVIEQNAAPSSTEPAAGDVGNVEAGAEATSPSTPVETSDGSSSAPSIASNHPAESLLARIEEMTLFWGGEVMTEIRNLVGSIRNLL